MQRIGMGASDDRLVAVVGDIVAKQAELAVWLAGYVGQLDAMDGRRARASWLITFTLVAPRVSPLTCSRSVFELSSPNTVLMTNVPPLPV